MAEDTSPVADSKEWWQMQAERYKAEVEQVTNDARAATGKHAEAIAAKDAELAKALDIAQQSDAEHAKTTAALNAHRAALGDVMGTLGPAFARMAQLLQG